MIPLQSTYHVIDPSNMDALATHTHSLTQKESVDVARHHQQRWRVDLTEDSTDAKRNQLWVFVHRMENSTQLIANSVSSDDVLSSNPSTDDCRSESVEKLHRRTKNGVRSVIDRKIFIKFHRLTKTLKETRTNLLNMDQMLGRYKDSPKAEPVNFAATRPRGRRTASVPPPLRISNCHLCGGDSSHQTRSQSVDNLEAEEIFKTNKNQVTTRQSQSMQDLQIAPSSVLAMTKDIVPSLFHGKVEEAVGDALNSARGSDISMGLPSATVEEMRSDILNLKTQLQKLEMSGHFQNQTTLLCQQVEMKDRLISEMNHHLQELSNKLEISEEQRCQLLLRLEDTLRTSLDVGSEAERFAAEVKRVEEMAVEVQADKDRLRRRARKIVLELKEKCKQYLADTQRLREREWELEQRCNQTSQENSLLTGQVTGFQDRIQDVMTELQGVKVKRDEAQQRLQRKELEITELKAVYQEMQKNIQNFKEANQKFLSNTERMKSKCEALQSEKTHLDMKLVAQEKELVLSLQRLEELKNEVKSLRASNGDYQAQLLSESSLRQAVEHAGQEMAEKVHNLEAQLSSLQNKYLEVINEHGKVTENMRQEMAQQKNEEDQKHQELMKNTQVQYESRFTALKLDLAENQARIQALQEALAKEQETKLQLKNELSKSQEEQTSYDEKTRHLAKSCQMKKKKLQEKTQQLKYLQDNFLEVQDMAKSLEEDFKDILYLIYNDVEATVSMLVSGSNAPPPPHSVDCQQPKQLLSRDWLSGIKAQLRWIQDEIAHMPPMSLPPQHHTVSVDSVHTHVPLMSPKVELKIQAPNEERHQPPPIYLIEKSDRGLHDPKQKEQSGSTEIIPLSPNDDECGQNAVVYPLNSTEIADSQKTNWESTHTEILKRYQRFQQIFDNISADFSKSNIHFEREQTVDTTKTQVPASTGLLSSSLSSISEFSCDAAVEEITSDMVNDVLKLADAACADNNDSKSPINTES